MRIRHRLDVRPGHIELVADSTAESVDWLAAGRDEGIIYFVFDFEEQDGRDLGRIPLEKRKVGAARAGHRVP